MNDVFDNNSGFGAQSQLFLKTFVCFCYITLLPSPYGGVCVWLRANKSSFGQEFTAKTTGGDKYSAGDYFLLLLFYFLWFLLVPGMVFLSKLQERIPLEKILNPSSEVLTRQVSIGISKTSGEISTGHPNKFLALKFMVRTPTLLDH